jgi:putative intracellular protease/amidase
MAADPLPSKVGIILFPGFQLLDYAGPLDALNILSNSHTITLSTLASSLDPVPTQNWVQDQQGSNCSQSIVPTHTFADAPTDLDVLLIPGGLGARGAGSDVRMEPVVNFLKSYLGSVKDDGSGFTGAGSKVKWVITVCTGSEILARTGILDGRRATTNKRAFNDVSFNADVMLPVTIPLS